MDTTIPAPKSKDKRKTIPVPPKKEKSKDEDTGILGWGLARKAADDIIKRKEEQKKLLDSI